MIASTSGPFLSISIHKTINSQRKEFKQCRLRQKIALLRIKKFRPQKHSNHFSELQTQLRPSRIISKQSSGAFLLINTGSYLPVTTPPPGVLQFKSKWTRRVLDSQINTRVLCTQKPPVCSLSYVRGMICPGQTYISSDATETALLRFPDLAPVVCPFYEQMASGACFSALRMAILLRR